jgi:hypothetical protein
VVKSLTLPLVALLLALPGTPAARAGTIAEDSCWRVYAQTPPSVPAPYAQVCPQ